MLLQAGQRTIAAVSAGICRTLRHAGQEIDFSRSSSSLGSGSGGMGLGAGEKTDLHAGQRTIAVVPSGICKPL